MSIRFNIVPTDTDTFDVHLRIPPENPRMRGFITVTAKVRSKAELKAFGERIDAGEYDGDIEALRDMFTEIKGLGTDAGPIEGEAVWEFLQTSKAGSYIVPALIEAYFQQYQQARQGNSQRRRSR